jgi:hypothetical protein
MRTNQKLLPKVFRCLRDRGVDVSMVVFKVSCAVTQRVQQLAHLSNNAQWLRTAFAEVLPPHVLLRVWDLYFLHGVDFLFRIAVAVFALVEVCGG